MAAIIKVNGETTDVRPKNGTDFSLEEMKEIVGGYIEVLFLEGGDLMVVNEDGKNQNLPLNTEATEIIDGDIYYDGDVIVGDVLLCGRNQIK